MIRDLYPQFNAEQLKEAEETLQRYVQLVLRIYERVREDPGAYERLKDLMSARRKVQ